MRYGINTLLWTAAFDTSHLDLLPKIKEQGFDGVEVARFNFDGFPTGEIRKALERNALECTFCSALTGQTSLIADTPVGRRAAQDFLIQGIQTAAELGAKVFAGPFCSPVGYLPGRRRTTDEWKRAVDGLQYLGDILERHNVILAVEPLNRFETYFLNTAEDAVRLCEEVRHPNIGVLADTFHFNIEEKSIGNSLRSLGKHLKHVHTCENDRGIPGSGHVEWNDVMSALADMRYDGWVVIESFGARIPEIAAAACIWRDLAPSSEAIAFEGLRFLKGKGRSSERPRRVDQS